MKMYREINKFASVIRCVHPHIRMLWLGYGFFSALTPFIFLFFSSIILNQLIQKAYMPAFQSACLMCVLILCSSFCFKLLFNTIEVVRRTAVNGIDQALLSKAMVMEYEKLEQQETMDTLRRTRLSISGSGDVGSAILFMSRCSDHMFRILFALSVFLYFMIQIRTWDMYFFILITAFLLFLLIKNRIAKQHGKYLEELCEYNDRSNGMGQYLLGLFQRMDSAKEMRLYQMDEFFIRKNDEMMKDPSFINFAKNNGLLNFKADVVGQCFSFSAYIYVATLALRSIISIGDVLYISGVILNAVNAIADLQHDYAQLRHQLSYLNEFHDFLYMPNMHYDGTLPIEKRDDQEYCFEFQDVSFHYPGSEHYSLDHVSIVFHLHEKLAIVGMNGAGKTTIVKLLCRLYEPSSGRILLNGIDIRNYDYKEYVQLFSIVFQDFSLFSYPLDENIASHTEVDKQVLDDVLQRLDMRERVQQFKDQTHTLLYKDNGDGVQLSKGEAQKVAIARALYKDAPFVILDEPTAALDPIAEAEIYSHFDVLVEGKTTLYISHRMSSCKFCDRILVMDQGRIVEEGSHHELIKNANLYAKLWDAQACYYTT